MSTLQYTHSIANDITPKMEAVQYQCLKTDGLSDDEVDYELRVRGLLVLRDNKERRRTILHRKFEEESVSRKMPASELILDDTDVAGEIGTCRQKIAMLANAITIEPKEIWLNRARHIKNRLKRLAVMVPSADKQCVKAHDELMARMQQFISHTEANDQSRVQNLTAGGSATKMSDVPAKDVPNPGAGSTHVSTVATQPPVAATNTGPAGNKSITATQLINHIANQTNPNIPPANFVTAEMLNQSMRQLVAEMTNIMHNHRATAPAVPNAHTEWANSTQHHQPNASNIMFDHTPEPSMMRNVTVVPYGQTPVAKWNTFFTGRTKREDPKATEDVYMFFQRIEELMLAHRVSNEEIVEKVNLLMDGPAHLYLKELARRGINNWADIKRKFLKRFANIDEENIRHEIYARKQRHEERTLDFIDAMCELISRLPVAISEPTRLQMIFRGMDTHVARLARARNVRNVDELTEYIIDTFGCEDSAQARSAAFRNKPNHRFEMRKVNVAEYEEALEYHQATDEPVDAIETPKRSSRGNNHTAAANKIESTLVCWNCETKGHGLQMCDKPRTGLICYGCGQRNETILSCKKCSSSIKPPTPTTEATPTVSTPQTNEYEVVYEVSNAIYASTNDQRPHASVTMNQLEMEGLLDTGAHVTVLGYNHLSEIEKRHVDDIITPARIGIKTADGSVHEAMGVINTEYKMNNRYRYVRTIVLPNTSKKLLLGMDFMTQFDVRLIDWESLCTQFHEAKVKLAHTTKLIAKTVPAAASAEVLSYEKVAPCVKRVVAYRCQAASPTPHLPEIKVEKIERLLNECTVSMRRRHSDLWRNTFWVFLLELLNDQQHSHILSWHPHRLNQFEIHDMIELAKVWAQSRGKTTYDVENVRRVLRIYDKGFRDGRHGRGIIRRVSTDLHEFRPEMCVEEAASFLQTELNQQFGQANVSPDSDVDIE